jgi:lipopolysaccharide transport system ATP-binding protein
MASINVINLGKAYKRYSSRWSRLLEWLMLGKYKQHQLKWVLQDINFRVNPGEAVAIVGVNGAGKSTLLKMIAGTVIATTGEIITHGKVTALLELGMGFHPDFTGRQNVLNSCQLLGMTLAEGLQLLPEIEAFAEIDEYFDQPVRVYSSGMQMRLAFSVATSQRPDVLIVDEALSVGDAYFQHKSFDRIRKFRELGTTLLLVSHDRQAIQSICDRAILLDGGNLSMDGAPESVMDFYNACLANSEHHRISKFTDISGTVKTISGTGEVEIVKARMLNAVKDPIDSAIVGQTVTLDIDFLVKADLPDLVVGYMIKDRFGQCVYGTNTCLMKDHLKALKSGERLNYQFTYQLNIGMGSYSISIAAHAVPSHLVANYVWEERVLIFEVTNGNLDYFEGMAWLPPKWTMRRDKSYLSNKSV